MYAAATRRSSSYTTGATSSALGGCSFGIKRVRRGRSFSSRGQGRFLARVVHEIVRAQDLCGARAACGVLRFLHLRGKLRAIAGENAVENRRAIRIGLFDDRQK